jgi:hypothetical protein
MTTETETPPQFIKLMEMEKALRNDKSVIKIINENIIRQKEKQITRPREHQYPFILSGIEDITKIDNINVGVNTNWDLNNSFLEIYTKMSYLNECTSNMTHLKVYSKQYVTHQYYKYRFPEYKREWNKIVSLEENIVINVCVIDILNNLKWDKYSGGFIFINDSNTNIYYDIITQNNCNKLLSGFITSDNIKSPHKDNECSVCFELIGYNLKCGHRCCIECQQKLTKKTCPICRKKIREFITDHHREVCENEESDSEDEDDE